MSDRMSQRSERKGRIVRMKLVDGSVINGQVNIARGAGYDRLSDLVGDAGEPFLILFDAVLYDAVGEVSGRSKTLFVNKTQVLWIEPDEDQK